MRNMLIVTALASGLALAGCGRDHADENAADMAAEANLGADTADAGAMAATDWPEGTRIVEEGGVYYRVEPTGTRIRLEPGDSTIVVDNGVRYRVDPGGTRVRIDEQGAVISVGPDGVDANIPVGGNTSVVVNTQ